MIKRLALACVVALPFVSIISQTYANDDIPKAAWKRPIGEPLQNPGTKKPTLDGGHIDNGFWQGAPVGGFGLLKKRPGVGKLSIVRPIRKIHLANNVATICVYDNDVVRRTTLPCRNIQQPSIWVD